MPHDVICPVNDPWWEQLLLELAEDDEWFAFSLGGGENPETHLRHDNYRKHF